jgi:hypothetical protein
MLLDATGDTKHARLINTSTIEQSPPDSSTAEKERQHNSFDVLLSKENGGVALLEMEKVLKDGK